MRSRWRTPAAVTTLVASIAAGFIFWSWRTDPHSLTGLLANRPAVDGRLAWPLAADADVIIVNFWATWCAPCIQETPSLFRLVAGDKKIILISISEDDSPKELQKFLGLYPGSQAANVFVVHDLDRRLAKSMAVTSYPTSYIFPVTMLDGQRIEGPVNWESPPVRDLIEKIRRR